MYSEMFNELFQLNLETRRWFPMVVRAPKAASNGKQADGAGAVDGAGASSTAPSPAAAAAACVTAPPAAPEFMSALQQHANDPRSAFYRAAQRIQANFRGFVVRKVR